MDIKNNFTEMSGWYNSSLRLLASLSIPWW